MIDSNDITGGTREPPTYRESIEATAERRGWSCREEKGAMVVSDGRSECRHRLSGHPMSAGYGAAQYTERIERDDVHLAEARAYIEEERREQVKRWERDASEAAFAGAVS